MSDAKAMDGIDAKVRQCWHPVPAVAEMVMGIACSVIKSFIIAC